MLLILEDDKYRTSAFERAMALSHPTLLLKVWTNAPAMIAGLDKWLPMAHLISLDHDLEPTKLCQDPGDGMAVVRALALRAPCCPVIVHTSNEYACKDMMATLTQARWNPTRVAPVGRDWIPQHWALVAQKLLSRQ
jgi:hypothetical protein